jgi:hypothetical protein
MRSGNFPFLAGTVKVDCVAGGANILDFVPGLNPPWEQATIAAMVLLPEPLVASQAIGCFAITTHRTLLP